MSNGEDTPTPEPTPEGEPTSAPDEAADPAATSQGDEGSAEAGEVVDAQPEEPQVVEVPDPLAELQARYDEAQARLRTVSKAYRDLQEEMSSFRERMEARSKVNSELQVFDQVRRFFDPVMNLRRSLQQPTTEVEALRNGLEMVQRQFMEAMEKLGLEEVPGEGSKFDPAVHEALAVTPVADAALDGVVLQVYASGYAVKGKVLQAAQVVIGKHEPAAGEA